GVEPLGTLLSAPLDDLATVTTLSEAVRVPDNFTADDSNVYIDDHHDFDKIIFKVPLAGGPPVMLAAGNPLGGMLSHDGYLYWLDSSAHKLERVAVTGGAVEPL